MTVGLGKNEELDTGTSLFTQLSAAISSRLSVAISFPTNILSFFLVPGSKEEYDLAFSTRFFNEKDLTC